jgi:hypothetical protein
MNYERILTELSVHQAETLFQIISSFRITLTKSVTYIDGKTGKEPRLRFLYSVDDKDDVESIIAIGVKRLSQFNDEGP